MRVLVSAAEPCEYQLLGLHESVLYFSASCTHEGL